MTQLKPVDQTNSSWQRATLLATDNSHSIIGEIFYGKHDPIAYTAYGEQSAQQEDRIRLGFNGQLREAKIGWYLLGNGYRAYNPRLMRFHSPDSWSPFAGGGLNAYMYCAGDPINRADPTGHVGWLKDLFTSIKKGGFGMGKSRPVPLENLDLSGAIEMIGTAHRQRINAVTPPPSPSFLGMLGEHLDSLPQRPPSLDTASVPTLTGHGPGGRLLPVGVAPTPTRPSSSSSSSRFNHPQIGTVSPKNQLSRLEKVGQQLNISLPSQPPPSYTEAMQRKAFEQIRRK
jgi:RHS repeat-associated protein